MRKQGKYFRKENGAIAALVVVTVLMFVLILGGTYMAITNLRKKEIPVHEISFFYMETLTFSGFAYMIYVLKICIFIENKKTCKKNHKPFKEEKIWVRL